jgi:hypothetical protein
MLGVVKMLSGVLVLGRVAAADMTAFHTKPKVDPGIARFEAFLATLRGVWLNFLDFIEMGTGRHSSIVQLLIEDTAAGNC